MVLRDIRCFWILFLRQLRFRFLRVRLGFVLDILLQFIVVLPAFQVLSSTV